MQSVSKRDKKRAQDRNAQRAARQRTRNRLEQLEETIARMQRDGDRHLEAEVERMRKERDHLGKLADQMVAIAGAVKTTVSHNETGLMDHLFDNYEALRSDSATATASELDDTHVILNGILNGWDMPVASHEEPMRRLMAQLHRHFMTQRPMARPVDQLAVLWLVQLSVLFLLGDSHSSQIPGWLLPVPTQTCIPHLVSVDMLPWPKLRAFLLSKQTHNDAASPESQRCESFAIKTLRHLYFQPTINFEEAYVAHAVASEPECCQPRRSRLAISPRFRQLFFQPDCSPFAVDPALPHEFPEVRGLVPEYQMPATAETKVPTVSVLRPSLFSPLASGPGNHSEPLISTRTTTRSNADGSPYLTNNHRHGSNTPPQLTYPDQTHQHPSGAAADAITADLFDETLDLPALDAAGYYTLAGLPHATTPSLQSGDLGLDLLNDGGPH
ncbi:uncharacterized protein K452DRAFT_322361 [Aplosporella prunicola CBS 121167]|uniref:BZIP domain-containing protein n=1 Tax=Aplosporella prunicola CBS 121167 TaxID=1176127 RepID=A0A6A6AZB5_9PEZI|nr:uncharacterized protein K452DRAFT_322361 [Aplosporella prunicola CBS 121167]KAF2136533.1 hypothetical protein K452DRAFT_322361 [Aplosporella prunicola CBS 121167]